MNSQPNNIIYFYDMKENLTLNKDNKSNIEYSNDYNIIEKNNLNTYVEVDKTLNIKTDNEDNIIFKIIYSKLGFENIGNTCYANSLIQVLIHSYNFMIKLFNDNIINKANSLNITKKFYDIINRICYSNNNNENYINISDLLYLFDIKHPSYKITNQNDSQEFCRILLEDFENELNIIRIKPKYHELIYDKNQTKLECIEIYEDYQNQRIQSIIKDIFYTKFIHKFECQCKKEIYSCQYMTDIPLIIDPKIINIKLETLLDNFFDEEIVSFNQKCYECQKICNHKKFSKIYQVPEILIISLQRFNSENNNKSETIVEFSEYLNLTKYIDNNFQNSNEKIYKLYAVINHIGSLSEGHYYSFINFYNKNTWYEFNDKLVSEKYKNLSLYFDKSYI